MNVQIRFVLVNKKAFFYKKSMFANAITTNHFEVFEFRIAAALKFVIMYSRWSWIQHWYPRQSGNTEVFAETSLGMPDRFPNISRDAPTKFEFINDS